MTGAGESQDAFRAPGHWYRGNIHMHSTRSDGALPPDQLVALYAERGYDFLALTDHRQVTRLDAAGDLGPLLLPAMEVDLFDHGSGRPWHIVGLGLQSLDAQPPEVRSAQQMVNALRAAGGLAIALHPYWLGLDASDLLAVEGLTAVEVYNYSHTWRHNGKGLSTWTWDGVLGAGRTIWATAADDAHAYPGDAANGWIMVRAAERSGPAILRAISAGHFYASSGPTLHDVRLENGQAHVACSPVERVRFVADGWNGDSVASLDGADSLTSAAYTLRGNERYLRVEAAERNGATAWSQPLFVR